MKALLNVVDNARSFIYIAVMNYLPTMEFSHPRRYFWERGQGPGQGATKWKRSGSQSDGQESRQWGHSKGTDGEEAMGRGRGDEGDGSRFWVLQIGEKGTKMRILGL